jgi:hypothetical protein
MKLKAPGLEVRADALLKRLQLHNLGKGKLTDFEIRSVLKDVHAIGKMNLTESVSADVLERADRTMKQAATEAGKVIARLAARAGANRAANDD